MKILIVDDEQLVLTSIKRIFKRKGYQQVDICNNGEKAIELIKTNDYDIVLLDLLMPGIDGIQVLEKSKPFKPETEFIILTAVDDVSSAVKTIRLGAYDYLVKTTDPQRLILTTERAYEHKGLLAGLAGAQGRKIKKVPKIFESIITRSPRMLELLSFAQIMAKGGNPVLITGESGTGKELLSRGIHKGGPFPKGPFVPVNVASIPESLFESQFFGHLKGAFTGAQADYPGFFRQANGGTLFLDEIGELPFNLQAKLLRVLEEKTVTPIGETKSIPVDFRIVSATNQDLDIACQKGKFRLDLMYRLKSATIHLPPLRERREDIQLLAEYFLEKACNRHDKHIKGFSSEAMAILRGREFPGNIRELAQLVETSVLLTETDFVLPQALGETFIPVTSTFARRLCTLKEDSLAHVAYVLTQTQGNRQKTAEILGITIRQIQRKIALMKKDDKWKKIINDI